MATAEVVPLFLERLGKGDTDVITELFADDIDWRLPGRVLPWAGRRSHRSEVPEFFRVLESACVPAETRVDGEKMLVAGEDAVVFGPYPSQVRQERANLRHPRGGAHPGGRRQDRALAPVRGHRPRRGRVARPLSRPTGEPADALYTT